MKPNICKLNLALLLATLWPLDSQILSLNKAILSESCVLESPYLGPLPNCWYWILLCFMKLACKERHLFNQEVSLVLALLTGKYLSNLRKSNDRLTVILVMGCNGVKQVSLYVDPLRKYLSKSQNFSCQKMCLSWAQLFWLSIMKLLTLIIVCLFTLAKTRQ